MLEILYLILILRIQGEWEHWSQHLTWVGEKTRLRSTDWLPWTSTMLTLVFFLTLHTDRNINEAGIKKKKKKLVTFHILFLV